jgi:mRNA-degrading endonuclease toxin of MazEF toxin-antitoxin module
LTAGKTRRGDVHVQFHDVGGNVLRGPHPAVVVSSDRLNRADGTVLVCSLTSKRRLVAGEWLPPYLVPLTVRDSGLDRDGFVKCDQVFTRPAPWLGERVGRLRPEAMTRVDASLRFVLGL